MLGFFQSESMHHTKKDEHIYHIWIQQNLNDTLPYMAFTWMAFVAHFVRFHCCFSNLELTLVSFELINNKQSSNESNVKVKHT